MIFDHRRLALPLFLLFMLPVAATAGSIREYLEKCLVYERHLPPVKESFPPDFPEMLYVLGGTQESLAVKIKTVGRLQAEGRSPKILFLHRPGITEFAPTLGRNYTNDEWATVQLKKEGIDVGSIEFITVDRAFFATFSEARVVSTLARSRGARRLVLVSSRHHAQRVWRSFSHFNADNRLDLYVYGSGEEPEIVDLLRERLKLPVYRYLVFPIDRLRSGR